MTIRGWAHLILVDLGQPCPGETGPDGRLAKAHEAHCTALCDRLVAFGVVRQAEPLAPATAPPIASQVASVGFGGVHRGHIRRECSCGRVIFQCRCMGPKTVEVVPKGCPECQGRN